MQRRSVAKTSRMETLGVHHGLPFVGGFRFQTIGKSLTVRWPPAAFCSYNEHIWIIWISSYGLSPALPVFAFGNSVAADKNVQTLRNIWCFPENQPSNLLCFLKKPSLRLWRFRCHCTTCRLTHLIEWVHLQLCSISGGSMGISSVSSLWTGTFRSIAWCVGENLFLPCTPVFVTNEQLVYTLTAFTGGCWTKWS